MRPTSVLPFAVVLLLAAPATSQTTFVDVTSPAGLNVTHQPAPGAPFAAMTGGATFGDFNRDGWPDLFMPSGGLRPDYLFINQKNGTFVDESAQWGITALHYGVGSCVGDFDRDGWDDLYETSMGPVGSPGPYSNKLYHNNRNGTFTEVAAAAGVQIANTVGDGFGCVFGDYDLDGWLDLFVTSYGPGTKGDRLYHNDQNGTFHEVTNELGIRHDAAGFVPCFVDMDGDRWPELLLIGDHGSSEYYINNGGKSFTYSNSTVERIGAPNGMGLAVADVNGDQLLDFYVSDSYYATIGQGGNRLYINHGGHNYTEEGQLRGCNQDGWGWGVTDFDVDNDGLVDLAATNGWFGQWDGWPSKVFQNAGNGQFLDITNAVGFQYTYWGRSILHADIDLDGDQDMVLAASSGPLKAYRNDLSNGNHWISINYDTSANPQLAPHGYGTRVEITAGGHTQVEYMDLGQSFLGCPEQVTHFGLGSATVIDELRLHWFNGFTTVLHQVPVDQYLTVTAPMPLTQTPLRRGQMATWTVTGADAGESVLFLFSSNGVGAGNSIPALGGLTLDLVPPAQQAGLAVAGSDGVAQISQLVPNHAPVHLFGFQAVIQRGTAGAGSVKTNAILAPVLP